MINDNKIAVYTCVTNKYDKICFIPRAEECVDFICFTDNQRHIPPEWQVRSLQSPLRIKSGHDINRFHKMFPHRILADYRYSIYLDGNISYGGSFCALVEMLKSQGLALAAFQHPGKRNLAEEIVACRRYAKFDEYDESMSERQIAAYKKDGFPLDGKITANGFLVRDHQHSLLSLCMSLWWSHVFEFTKRDQLSLAYVKWKTGLPWAFLDKDLGVDTGLLIRVPHKKSLALKITSRLKRLGKSIYGRLKK